MKIVVDTSVWIAAVLSQRGASYEVLRRSLDREFEIIVSHSIYKELLEVLSRSEVKKFAKINPQELKAIKRFLKHISVGVANKIKISRDPNDDMFVQCAIEYGASHVLSLDKDLLSIKNTHGIFFLSPGDFLKVLRGAKL